MPILTSGNQGIKKTIHFYMSAARHVKGKSAVSNDKMAGRHGPQQWNRLPLPALRRDNLNSERWSVLCLGPTIALDRLRFD